MKRDNILQSHNNVPNDIREQLFAEEQQRLKRQPNPPANFSTPGFPSINIINMLPTSSYQSPTANLVDTAAAPVIYPSSSTLNIPEPRDLTVRIYSE